MSRRKGGPPILWCPTRRHSAEIVGERDRKRQIEAWANYGCQDCRRASAPIDVSAALAELGGAS